MSQSGMIPVHGGELHYDDHGSGDAVVFLHAGMTNMEMWQRQIEPFTAAGYRVVRYDLRGYGRSTSEEADYSHHVDLLDVFSYLKIERAHLVGNSLGGRICIDFALACPERTRSLILVCARPSGCPTVFPPAEVAKIEELEAAEQGSDHDLTARLDVEVFVDGFYREGQADAPVRDEVFRMTRANYDVRQNRQPSSPLTPPAYSRLHEITVPALVVVGTLDLRMMLKAADHLATQLPLARRLDIEGATHVPSLEQPDLFNREALAFLQGI
ncbi:MAG: alpha/beta hydrolase [Anaerolineae bacterium]|nr:alpha/beta hydrolase [Anaerolineae bacterium]